MRTPFFQENNQNVRRRLRSGRSHTGVRLRLGSALGCAPGCYMTCSRCLNRYLLCSFSPSELRLLGSTMYHVCVACGRNHSNIELDFSKHCDTIGTCLVPASGGTIKNLVLVTEKKKKWKYTTTTTKTVKGKTKKRKGYRYITFNA